jgi:hypothetical protein
MDRAAEIASRVDHEGVGFMLAENLIDLKQAELAGKIKRGWRA